MKSSYCLLLVSLFFWAPLTLIAPAWAQTEDQNQMCGSSDADIRMKGCTAIIVAGKAPADTIASAYESRGAAEIGKELCDQALMDENKAIAMGDDDAYFVRGMAYSCQKQPDLNLAIADFSKSIALSPNDPDRYYQRGRAYNANNQSDLAIADMTRVIAAQPDNDEALLIRANAYNSKGQPDLALADLDKAVGHHSSDPVIYMVRAALNENKGLKDKAIADYRAALKLDPSQSFAQDGLKRLGATP